MGNFIYYEKLEDYEEQVRKSKKCDEKGKEIERLKSRLEEYQEYVEINHKEIERLNEQLQLNFKGYKIKIKQYEDIIEVNHKIIDTLNEKIKKKDVELEDTKINLKNVYAWLKDSHRKIEKLENIINELENRDDVLEEFEDWLEKQKTINSEWDNFIIVDGRLGIPISYLLNKLQELKGSDK